MAGNRWVAPVLISVLFLAVTSSSGGTALSNAGATAALMFPASAWLTVATLNDEDPSAAAAFAAAAGGPASARRTRVAVSVAISAGLSLVALLTAYVLGGQISASTIGAGLTGNALTTVGGVAAGTLCARPIVTRTSMSLAVILLLTVLEFAVPGAPPTNLVLSALLADNADNLWPRLAIAAAVVAAVSAATFVAGDRVARRRY